MSLTNDHHLASRCTGQNLDSDDVREPLREIGVYFPHEIGHMLAAHGAIVEGKPISFSCRFAKWDKLEGIHILK